MFILIVMQEHLRNKKMIIGYNFILEIKYKYNGKNFYDGWMKNPKSAMISCNDGFRPVSFLIEVIEKAE